MIDAPQILEVNAQRIAFIHVTVPRDEIQKVMGPGVAELMSTLKAQGITPAGPWLTHHLKMQPGIFDLDIAVPVDRAVQETGRVRNGTLPAATVARTIYHGPYQNLGSAWPELDQWIDAQGRKAAAELWETYLTGPADEADPSRYRTELTRPLIEGS